MKIKKRSDKPAQVKTEDPVLRFREASFEVRSDADGKESLRMTVSSEAPVLTWTEFNDSFQRAYEILDHGTDSVDMSRCKDGLVILDQHGGDQIGLMAVDLTGRKMGGEVEFCSGARAQEIRQDATKKLRRNTSVGYRVNAESYRLEGEKDGVPVVRAMSWMPYEASFVPVPADPSVGVGRSLKENESKNNNTKGIVIMKTENTERKLTGEEVVEIYRLARAFGMEPGAADEHVKSDKSVEEFRALTLKKAESDRVETERKLAEQANRKPERPAVARDANDPAAKVFAPNEQREVAKRFSIMNVARFLDAQRTGGKSSVDIGYEREVSDEIAKRVGKAAQGFYIPHTAPVMANRSDPFLKGSNGSAFVATDLLIGQFIDALRTKMALAKAGVTTLSGLVGDVAIPKGGTITGGWIDGENAAGTEGKPTVSQVTGTPKTASGWCDISRRLMIQSSIDAEGFVQNELINTLARLIEVAALAGTNANGQPKGLTGQTGLNTPTLTVDAPTRAQLLSMVENIMTDNADFDGMAWLMRPTGWALLANLLDVRGVDNAGLTTGTIVGGGPVPEYALDTKTKTMLGFPYHVSMNVPNHALFFGAWSQLVIGLWSGVDLLVDPYSNSTSGATRIVALQDVDVMCRHGEAFSYEDALTS